MTALRRPAGRSVGEEKSIGDSLREDTVAALPAADRDTLGDMCYPRCHLLAGNVAMNAFVMYVCGLDDYTT